MEPVPNIGEDLVSAKSPRKVSQRWWRWFNFLNSQFVPQVAHAIFAGPTSGAAAQPAFRLMVPLDGPATAFSGTITTAKLTGTGTNGSMTFVNGFLTAQVQAT